MPDASPKHSKIAAAIAIVGSQAELARRCSCAQQTISKMLNGEISVTAEIAKKIDEATGGQVARWQLRPDLWDAPAGASSPTAELISKSADHLAPAWSGAEEQIVPDDRKVERAKEGCR